MSQKVHCCSQVSGSVCYECGEGVEVGRRNGI